jgi:hypothetical protein
LAEPKWKGIDHQWSGPEAGYGVDITEMWLPRNGKFAKRKDPGGNRRKPGKFTRYIQLRG